MFNIRKEKINSIGLGYGELALKGKNRGKFEGNIKGKIKEKIKEFDAELLNDLSKLYISFNDENAEDILLKIKNIFGINNINLAIKVDTEMSEIKDKILEIAKDLYEDGARNFKVEVNRGSKDFPLNSMELAKELGAHILINSEFEHVKMKNPDVMIKVDLRRNTYIYTEKIKAYGGLPLGSTGRGMSLISGGIDSPVASFMMAKRGLKLNYVTFHSYPFTSKKALDKISDLIKILSEFNGNSKFFTMNTLKIQQEINSKTNKDLATILIRRVMMRLAERLAIKEDSQALITGESLGQVASQTLGGITCTNMSVEKVPVFRPLIGMDKIEIIDIANEIGTYEKSIEPHDDTCALFAPKHPVTNPNIEDVIAEEKKIENYEELLDEIFSERKMILIKN